MPGSDTLPPADRPLTVAALTRRISLALEDFGPLTVQGELSLVKLAPSGHLYATLKDGEAVISLVMWRSQVVRNGPLPKEGDQVLVRGTLSVYGPRGQYQLVATRITPQGLGDLAARFEALKRRLADEGLFAEERKIPLPYLPRCVGLATAAGSAALADLLHSIRARFPRMPVVHAHCLVQGTAAPDAIVAAIRALDRHDEVDVIIAGRGGGSLEDLWAFNDERVVRAIAACRKPIVSAVGHETDTTLADLAADVRAKTPTAAGELIVPVEADLREQLDAWRRDLDQGLERLLDEARARLASLASHRALAGPGHQVALRRQRLDELAASLTGAIGARLDQRRADLSLLRSRLAAGSPERALRAAAERLGQQSHALDQAVDRRLAHRHEHLAAAAAHLDALSPLAVLGRGYSVLRDAAHRLVRHCDQAPVGSAIEARTQDGWLTATVTGTRRQRLNEAPPEGGHGA